MNTIRGNHAASRASPPVSATPYAVDDTDRQLLAAVQPGLPLSPRPFAELGARLGLDEREVITRLARLRDAGVIKRFGVVVRHHEVGYGANAMVVWDVPDDQVRALGRCLADFDFITLCYQRPRRLPRWRYNLYCMIHSQSREQVLAHLEWMVNHCGLQSLPHEVLFSRRRFKQRGAVYFDEQGRSNAGSAPDARLEPADEQGRSNAGSAPDARLEPADEQGRSNAGSAVAPDVPGNLSVRCSTPSIAGVVSPATFAGPCASQDARLEPADEPPAAGAE